jgi:hypothetical protein
MSRARILIWPLLFLSVSIACSRGSQPQTQSASPTPVPAATAESYPALTARAKEITDAFTSKDYMKVLEMTYAKVIENAGGREKMMATMKSEIKEMESQGVNILSTTPGSPTQFVHDAGSIYAVVPIILKIKAQDGTYQTDGSLIGVSSDAGANWTFIDAAGEDDKDLQVLLPAVLNKLKVPAEKPPVKISE